jgi:hypothetical protein
VPRIWDPFGSDEAIHQLIEELTIEKMLSFCGVLLIKQVLKPVLIPQGLIGWCCRISHVNLRNIYPDVAVALLLAVLRCQEFGDKWVLVNLVLTQVGYGLPAAVTDSVDSDFRLRSVHCIILRIRSSNFKPLISSIFGFEG